MEKYEFESSTDGDPLVKLKENQDGVVNFLLIAQETDLLYFNLKELKDHYDTFDVTSFGRRTFPPRRLMHLDEETLRKLSQSAKVPLDEIVEIADIERTNWEDVIKQARIPGFYASS